MNGKSVLILILGAVLLASARRVAAESRERDEKPLIQIGVEVVEVDEKKATNLGIQWLETLHVSEVTVPSLFNVGTFTRDTLFADLHFLESNGAADLLANPKLVARDGASATFHAGGEIPYATTGTQGSVTVEFKSYGIDLKITPHLNDQDQIEMSVSAEVSGPDSQNGVTLSGNVVPAIRSRNVSTELTLAQGSTLTMAGLLQNEKEWIRTGVPGLMRIPLLKYLFSHKVETYRKTSIVVFVTPVILDSPKVPRTSDLRTSFSDDDLLRIEEAKDMGTTRG
jgi:pilus assembly protein CpaC